MADSLNLNTTPLFIAAGTEYEATIQNGGPGTVYYGTTKDVSSSSYDGTIADGGKLHITTPKWIVATTITKVFINRETHVEDVDYDVKVIGETLQLSNDATTDNADILQTAQDNIESQGGGRILIGASGNGQFAIGSQITFGHKVNIIGQGKRETQFLFTDAASMFYFVGSGDAGYSGSTNRGGESGGFHLQGNNTATTVMTMRSTNRMIKDIRLSTPANNGKALYIDQSQNCNWINVEAEDGSHSGSRSVQGVVFDGAAAGHNFFGTSLNEFTNGHVVFDASYDAPSELGVDYSKNIIFVGNMIERTDTGNPIIYVKAGLDIHFDGGNIAAASESGTFTPSAEYDIIKIDNTAARSYSTIGGSGAPTRAISFRAMNMTGALNGSTRYANAFRCAADLTAWTDALYVDPTCTYDNCKYLARIDAGSVNVIAPNAPNAAGGGLVGWSNPAGTGKINTRKMNTATTVEAIATCNYYELASNTNIDSITATYSGHKIDILFSGTPTVSSSAGNIKLSGLSDMSATANDLLCLICDGTNWHETSRVVK